MNEEINPVASKRLVTTGDPPEVMEALAPGRLHRRVQVRPPAACSIPTGDPLNTAKFSHPVQYMEQFHADFADKDELEPRSPRPV